MNNKTIAKALALSFINGNKSYVKGEIGNDLVLLARVNNELQEVSQEYSNDLMRYLELTA